MANTDAANVSDAMSDRNNIEMDNMLPSVRGSGDNGPSANDGIDDDELLRRAAEKISDWKAAADPPSLSQVQTLFNELICDGGSTMLRDKVVDAVVKAFGTELGGKRGLTSTWTQIAKDDAAQRAQAARELGAKIEQQPLTAEQKAAMRDALWPAVRELAEAPDLLERAVQQCNPWAS